MRHRVAGRRLGRDTEHRRALERNLLVSLFRHERIQTTLAKAKEYRPRAEKLITLAKADSVARRRRAFAVLQDKAVVRKLFEQLGPRFQDRPGGYTRILRLPKTRVGDNAPLALLELLPAADGGSEGAPSEAGATQKGGKRRGRKKQGEKKA